MKIYKLVALIGLGLLNHGHAQQKQNWVSGEVLVQLNENENSVLLQRAFTSLDLQQPELLSEHMHIWRYTFDPERATIDQAIQALSGSEYVATVQRNHVLTSRAVPNDTDYEDQWQYEQENDRDIDADLAWNVTTGGLTPLGDTIVVCVIDDGVNLEHPDLVPNLWRNYNEIPGNGIDDDGNGYIDDIRGWNAYTGNDNVAHEVEFGEGHGSAVAGIVGAKGNNNLGVAGVNWDVKVMVVKGGGVEAQAIAAYDYALANRKLYNSTNGEKGAFVVATNASWGVDGGSAESAPLWCAMYDTLGNYGVLNAGATANANVNVDTFGDLPTQCASPFLIAVTNTTITDVKETGAGYGATSIDLGAPGSGTWTVDQFSNGYAAFGGTSGATPHVAGTIGLLYAVPCNSFGELARSNPKLAAEKVRDFILNGVDANASLADITTTGGRLNVNNSVQALVGNCEALSIKENKTEELTGALVYPNPLVGDQLTIQFASAAAQENQLIITDMSGKVLYNQAIKTSEGMNQVDVVLPNLATGMYAANIIGSTTTIQLKFMK